MRALNRLAKWRTLFAGWQLGTRPDTDPEAKAIKDHREATMFLRVEVTTLARLLMVKGVFTEKEWEEVMLDEIREYEKMLEEKFPGVKASDSGLDLNFAVIQEHDTFAGWKP